MEGVDVLTTVLSIVVLIAILLGSLAVLRWATSLAGGRGTRGRRGSDSLAVVERQGIGRNASIVVVRHGGRELLLGVTESSITPLAESTIDLREIDADDERERPAVRQLLDNLREKTVRR